MRVVVDTDVVVAAIRSATGASAELLRRALRGELTMAATTGMILEYEAVATRAEHLAQSGLTAAQVTTVIDAIAAAAERVELDYRWRPQLRDPDDEMIFEAAVNGGCLPIATINRRDFESAAARFGVVVMLPAEVLRRMER